MTQERSEKIIALLLLLSGLALGLFIIISAGSEFSLTSAKNDQTSSQNLGIRVSVGPDGHIASAAFDSTAKGSVANEEGLSE